MKKIAAVEEARALMTQAADWGLWKWLLEETRVQEVADRATTALANADKRVKAGWSDKLKKAYAESQDGRKTIGVASELRTTARRIKEAYDKGQRARVEAEETFEEAERTMSTQMAREGARKALESYDLREQAIRKAEAAEKK